MTAADTLISSEAVGSLVGLILIICALVLLGQAVARTADRRSARRTRPQDACDDDGTGRPCPCQPGDDEIERWITAWKEGGRG